MSIRTETYTKRKYASLAAVGMALLLSAVLVVPSLSAYADHDNGKGKSQDDKKHQKDRKGKGPKDPASDPKDPPKDPKRCLNGSSDKYNKHCES